jgi:hypothetical protein
VTDSKHCESVSDFIINCDVLCLHLSKRTPLELIKAPKTRTFQLRQQHLDVTAVLCTRYSNLTGVGGGVFSLVQRLLSRDVAPAEILWWRRCHVTRDPTAQSRPSRIWKKKINPVFDCNVVEIHFAHWSTTTGQWHCSSSGILTPHKINGFTSQKHLHTAQAPRV